MEIMGYPFASEAEAKRGGDWALELFCQLAVQASLGSNHKRLSHTTGPSHIGGTILASLALGLDNEWTRSRLVRGPLGRFPPEPIRHASSLLVRNAIRRKERAEDAGQQPSSIDIRQSRFAAAAGKADKA